MSVLFHSIKKIFFFFLPITLSFRFCSFSPSPARFLFAGSQNEDLMITFHAWTLIARLSRG